MRGVGFVRGTDSMLARVPAGSVSIALMHATDWLPTCAHLAKVPLTGTQPLDVSRVTMTLLHRQTLSVISRGSNCPGLQPVAVHRQRRADAAHLDRAQRAEVPRDKNKPELLPEFRGCGESRRLQVALRWHADRGLARMHRRSEQRAGGVHHDDADAATGATTARERHAAEAVRLHATRRVGAGEYM